MKDSAGKLTVVVSDAFFAHQLIVAHQNHALINHCTYAMAAFLANIGNAALIDFACESFLDGNGNGVVGIRFSMRGNGQNEVRVNLCRSVGMHGDHVETAIGKRARLIEHHRFGMSERFQVVTTLHQDAQTRSAANATEERKGNRDNEGARARNNQEGQAALNPIGPTLAEQQRRQHSQNKSTNSDNRRIVARKTRNEVFGLGLLLASAFHQLKNARDRGLLEGFAHFHRDLARHVYAARNHFGALFHMTRNGFSGKCSSVELSGTFHNGSVKRNALARLHHDLIAYANFVRIDLNKLAITHNIGKIGSNVHHVGDRLTRLAHGVALE